MSTLLFITFFLKSSLLLAVTETNVNPTFENIEGQPFHYQLVPRKEDQKKASKVIQGQVMMFSEPMPNEQTVQVKPPVLYKGQNCWVIVATAEENNPNFGANQYELKTRSKKITTYISEQGQILSIETVTKMGGNRNQNTETNLPAYETVNHFYGQWMLSLKADYKLLIGTEARGVSIAVEREENIGDRSCYVTRVTKRMNSEVKSDELYWVDKQLGIALRCISGDLTLNYIADKK